MKLTISLCFILFFSHSVLFAQNIELINSGELLDKGSVLYDSGEYKKALLLYDKIGPSDTNYVKALLAKSLSCQADSQYDRSIKYCLEALSLKTQRDNEPELYNTYGNTLNDMGKNEEALKIFDVAIAKYPAFSLLYFNKGVTYLTSNRAEEAEQWFKKTLMINPYMYSAHYQLGLAALRQGKIVPAFLSFLGYLLMNPEGKYESKSVALLSTISNTTDEVLEYKNKRTKAPDENYQATEEILLSKTALDKAYKPIIALDDPISRQIQAMFEKLEYKDTDNDFWIQYYLPFFKQVYNDGKFELFINHIFSNVKIQPIQDYNKKKKKELQAFVDDAVVYFNMLHATRELFYKKRDATAQKYLFESGSLVGKGALSANGKSLIGDWQFFFPAGNIKSIGHYNDEGKREGEWAFYFYSGKKDATEHYKNGKLEGQQEDYFENGVLSFRNTYINGELDGPMVSYYYTGALKSIVPYKMGKIDGEEKKYYSNGSILSVNNYSNDIQTGVSKNYYKSGQLKEIQQYENGKQDGPYKSYYEDGTLNVEGQFKKEKAEGEWKYNHENGKLREKRNYANDYQEGAYEEYYDNGKQASSYSSKKGKINGEALYYDTDGKLSSKYVYDNGSIKSAKYFDKSGREISTSESINNSLDLVTYTPDGFKKMFQHLDKNGNIDGADTLFYPSGTFNQINQFKNGEANGLAIAYHMNGNKKSEVNMTDGKEDGYYKSYYFNGQTESEGWFVNGTAQGQWYYYDELGKQTTKVYYLDGEMNGYREEYSPNGKKSLQQKYLRGWLEEMTQYDTSGNILAQDSFPQGNGKFVLYHQNKQKMIEANYVHGDFDGAYTTYHFDGSIESVQYYKKGLKDSVYTAFYYGGIKSVEGGFKYGKKYGIWKNYDEEGRLSATTIYVDDQVNGIRKYFFPDGKTDMESTYKDDLRDGMGTKYNAQGIIAYQVSNEDDKVVSYSYLGADGKFLPTIAVPADKGSLKSYFPNDKLSRQCNYINGKVNGVDVLYYMNGQILSTDSASYGVNEGAWKEYYEDGKLRMDYNYLHDNLQGTIKEFHKNGMLKKEMNFVNGLYNGLTKYYDDKGKLIKTMLYYYGKLISAKNEK